MREHNRDKERLRHILDAIQVIENGLNVLVHDYIHISKDILWITITQDIPHFKVHVEKFYKEDQISTDEYDVLLEMLLQREEQLKEPDEAVTERIRYLSDIDAPNDDIIRGHYK